MEKIKQLKALNVAYIAALEYDRCPGENESDNVNELFNPTGLNINDIKEALRDNEGRRPDEIVSSISGLINEL